MAKLKIGDILPWAVLIGGGYLVYTNWNSIQGFFGGLFSGASAPGGGAAGGGASKTYLCADGKTVVADPSVCSAYGGGGSQTASPQIPSPPSGGGSSGGGGGGGGVYVPSNPSPSAPVSASPSVPSGPVTAPATSQQQGDLQYLLTNARQFCVDNYCYKCDETGSIGYQCAIVSGPGITTPLLVTKDGRPAFANGTGYIGQICDSKNNCWQCDPTSCVQISYEGGPPPTQAGAGPANPSPPASSNQLPACSISNADYAACNDEVFKNVLPIVSNKQAAQAAYRDIWTKYPGCQDAQLLKCNPPSVASRTAGGAPPGSTTPPPASQTTPPPQTGGQSYTDLQILQAWDLNKTGRIDDTDLIAANTAWTEGKLIPGATQQQQDDAIRLLTKYWTNGTQFTAGGYTPASSQTLQSVQSRVPAGYTPGHSTVSVVGTPTVVSGPRNVGNGITAYLWSNGVWSYTYPNRRIAYRYPDGHVVYA